MRTVLATSVFCGVLGLAAAGQEKGSFVFLDLEGKANQKLKEPFHSGSEGNDLAELPAGEQVLAKVKFKVGAGAIQLGSTLAKDFPEKVEGIEVKLKLAKLHFLHGTGFGGYGKEGDPLFVADDTLIGEYLVHYDDKTTEKVPIVYGKDVRDWWNWDESKPVTRGKVAWEGTNDNAKKYNVKLRLFLTTWENPHPDKTVAKIDYRSTKESPAAPFCVAISAEGK
jgi:hypothetical protein